MNPNQTVFAIAPRGDGGVDVLLGVPTAAWEVIKDGHTQTFDLTRAGLPVRIILYGGTDQAEVLGVITAHNARLGVTNVQDRRRDDFSIEP